MPAGNNTVEIVPAKRRAAIAATGKPAATISAMMGCNRSYLSKVISIGKMSLMALRSFCLITETEPDNMIVKEEEKPKEEQPSPRQLDFFTVSELTDEQLEHIAGRVAAILAGRLMKTRPALEERKA